MTNPFLPATRVMDMDPKAFRLLIREAVAWGVLMANVLIALMIGMFLMLLRLIAMS